MYQKYIKRMLDFLLSLVALIVLSPFLLVIVILVYIKLGRPIIFAQERPGYKEKIFKIYKFRTMTNEQDEKGNFLPDELRLTKFGEFLRRTSIDELPELVNIIKGDMSIIGPRALLVKYLPYYSKEQHRRHDVRPGLVGLAALHGRNNQDWNEKLRWDIEYVNSVSFNLDLKIFFGAIGVVLKKEGVNQDGQATAEDFVEYIKNSNRDNLK